MDHLEVWCSVSKYWEIFLLSFCYCFLVIIHYGPRIYLDDLKSFTFVEVYFIAQNMIYLGTPMGNLKECIICFCWVECSINFNEILTVGIVEFIYILAYFPSSHSTNSEKGVDVSNINCGAVYFSFQVSFCFTYFIALLCIHI